MFDRLRKDEEENIQRRRTIKGEINCQKGTLNNKGGLEKSRRRRQIIRERREEEEEEESIIISPTTSSPL